MEEIYLQQETLPEKLITIKILIIPSTSTTTVKNMVTLYKLPQ